MSSPMQIFDAYSSSPQPTTCDCQNQLGHFNWDGIPHESLPDLCKRTMGIPISPKNDEIFTFGSDDKDTAAEPDPEWEQVILRRANRNQLKVRNESESVEVTDISREVNIVVDNGNADLTSTKGHKRQKTSDRKSANTWTSKNTKKGMDFRIKFRAGKKQSTVKISVKIT